jgi:hypothetical protein
MLEMKTWTHRLVAALAGFLAAVGLLNLATGFVGGAVWTVVALGGAVSGFVCASELRKQACRL